MKSILFLLLIVSGLEAYRDPFSYGPEYHLFACLQIGSLDSHSMVRLYDDGVIATLRVGDTYKQYKVVAIDQREVVLQEGTITHHLIV